LGDAGAIYQMACRFEKGNGIAKNDERMMFYMLQSAERDNLLAQINVAKRYHFGLGVPADDQEAIKWCVIGF
jgi:hypothetical protein